MHARAHGWPDRPPAVWSELTGVEAASKKPTTADNKPNNNVEPRSLAGKMLEKCEAP